MSDQQVPVKRVPVVTLTRTSVAGVAVSSPKRELAEQAGKQP
jgi:hypothetical protein